MKVAITDTPTNILAGQPREKQLVKFSVAVVAARTEADCTLDTGFTFAADEVYEVPEKVTVLFVRTQATSTATTTASGSVLILPLHSNY